MGHVYSRSERVHGTPTTVLAEVISQPSETLPFQGTTEHYARYTPTPNSIQARLLPEDVGDEYLAIERLETYGPVSMGDAALRSMIIQSDTTFRFEGALVQLRDDGLFILNSLRSSLEFRTAPEIMEYGNGFRRHNQRRQLTAGFIRAVEALDAMSREVTQKDFVERSRHGSGSNTRYRLMPDISWHDKRDH